MSRKPNTEQDFWSHVDIQNENECWNWQLYCNKSGYGQYSYDGQLYLTHRLAWIFVYGDIFDDLQVLHDPIICKSKACCNPNHLRLGSHKENHQDIDSAKLTWFQVNEIREMYNTGVYTYENLAVLFNISVPNIAKIITYKTWKLDEC